MPFLFVVVFVVIGVVVGGQARAAGFAAAAAAATRRGDAGRETIGGQRRVGARVRAIGRPGRSDASAAARP